MFLSDWFSYGRSNIAIAIVDNAQNLHFCVIKRDKILLEKEIRLDRMINEVDI